MDTIKSLPLILMIIASSWASVANAEQFCDDAVRRVAPDSRFKDLGNGELEDLKTGLVWQHCSIGQTWDGNTCTGEAENLTWLQALTKAKVAGSGYRLPNYKEAASLAELACEPSINVKFFPNIASSYYWTSTPNAGKGNQALLFSFYEGSGANQMSYGIDKESVFGGYYKTHALLVRSK